MRHKMKIMNTYINDVELDYAYDEISFLNSADNISRNLTVNCRLGFAKQGN